MKYCFCESWAAHDYGKVCQVLLIVMEKQVMSYERVNMFIELFFISTETLSLIKNKI